MPMSLAEARRKAGLSQQEVAVPLKVTRQAVSRWERGHVVPNIHQARKIAELLGRDLTEINFESPPGHRDAPPTKRVSHA